MTPVAAPHNLPRAPPCRALSPFYSAALNDDFALIEGTRATPPFTTIKYPIPVRVSRGYGSFLLVRCINGPQEKDFSFCTLTPSKHAIDQNLPAAAKYVAKALRSFSPCDQCLRFRRRVGGLPSSIALAASSSDAYKSATNSPRQRLPENALKDSLLLGASLCTASALQEGIYYSRMVGMRSVVTCVMWYLKNPAPHRSHCFGEQNHLEEVTSLTFCLIPVCFHPACRPSRSPAVPRQ